MIHRQQLLGLAISREWATKAPSSILARAARNIQIKKSVNWIIDVFYYCYLIGSPDNPNHPTRHNPTRVPPEPDYLSGRVAGDFLKTQNPTQPDPTNPITPITRPDNTPTSYLQTFQKLVGKC